MYTQKYCLVYFLSPVEVDYQFPMTRWPLHITLADVFAVNTGVDEVINKLSGFCNESPPAISVALKRAVLGTTRVVLLEKTQSLLQLHLDLVNLLKKQGVSFNMPEFTAEGFFPHCTIQGSHVLDEGTEVTVGSIALIDMFPDKNWKQRKVIANIKLAL